MLGYPVEELAHLDRHLGRGEVIRDELCAVGFVEDGLLDRKADFALVDVERANHLDVLRAVTADLVVHETQEFGLAVGGGQTPVKLKTLNQGAGSITDADDR